MVEVILLDDDMADDKHLKSGFAKVVLLDWRGPLIGTTGKDVAISFKMDSIFLFIILLFRAYYILGVQLPKCNFLMIWQYVEKSRTSISY